MSFVSLLRALNDTSFSIYLRESDLAFPLTECMHLVGLATSVGVIIWLDLRLLGISMRRERVSDLIARLEPLAMGGFTVMFLSGLLLFLGNPINYYSTVPYKIKMALLPVAGLNVLFFHKKVYPGLATWDADAVPPWQARLVGLASVTLWLVIIVLGRWTAYSADRLLGGAS